MNIILTRRIARRFASRRDDILCVAAILVLATLFLAPALRPGYTLLPLDLERGIAPWNKQVYQENQNLLLSDPFYQYYPFRNLLAGALRRGEFVLWNPYVLGGHPMMGDLLAQTFYPPNLVGALLFPLARAWVFLIWGHLGMTGLLMYGYLRNAGLRPANALLGATSWMLNATIVVWLETPHFLATISWLPGVFWLLSIARKGHQWRAVAGAGAMYGGLALAGQLQYALAAAWLIGVWSTFWVVMESVRRRRIIAWPLIAALVAVVLGAGIGMIQLAPALEFLQLSHRVGLPSTLLATKWPLYRVITLWLPDFYGNPVRESWWRDFNIAERSAYFGVWPFILSLSVLPWSRRIAARFWGGALLVMLLVVLGTPAAYLIGWMPGMRYVPLSRLLILVPFAGSVAAAHALHAAQEHMRQHAGRVWITLGVVIALLLGVTGVVVLPQFDEVAKNADYIWPQTAVLALLLIVGLVAWGLIRKHPVMGTVLIILLSCADLVAWGMPFNPVNSTEILYPENPITDWLRQDAGLYRVLPLHSDRVVFGPNVLSVFGFQEPGGYSSQVLARYRDLGKAIHDRVDMWWMAVNAHMLVHSEFDPLFSMLNVKYVLSSYQRPERITVEASYEGCAADVPLRPGEIVTQAFQVSNPGLNRVDVRFRPDDNLSQATLHFQLWRDHLDGPLIAEMSFEAAELSSGGKTFFLAPVPDSMGETFVWGVGVTKAEEGAGPALCRASDGYMLSFDAYSTQLKFVDTIQGVWIYENPDVLPRAYVCHHVEAVTDEDALARIKDKSFDPWHSVLVPLSTSPQLQALVETWPVPCTRSANVVKYTSHEVVVDVQTDTPGVLVLSDAYYPGWRVKVDGLDADLLRVNYALRGVYLDGGVHQVEFHFRPLSLCLGATGTLGTLLGAATLVWLDIRRSGKRQEQETASTS